MIGGCIGYGAQRAKKKEKRKKKKAHKHTASPQYDFVLCVSPLENSLFSRAYPAVHRVTTSFCLEFVVDFGSAFVNWMCSEVTIHSTHCGCFPLITISHQFLATSSFIPSLLFRPKQKFHSFADMIGFICSLN